LFIPKGAAVSERTLICRQFDFPFVPSACSMKLRKTLPTTIAGVVAVTAYFVEHRDRYPVWVGGEIENKPEAPDYPEDRPFEDSLIRNLAVALRTIKAN
jgi:hypothetical protein